MVILKNDQILNWFIIVLCFNFLSFYKGVDPLRPGSVRLHRER